MSAHGIMASDHALPKMVMHETQGGLVDVSPAESGCPGQAETTPASTDDAQRVPRGTPLRRFAERILPVTRTRMPLLTGTVPAGVPFMNAIACATSAAGRAARTALRAGARHRCCQSREQDAVDHAHDVVLGDEPSLGGDLLVGDGGEHLRERRYVHFCRDGAAVNGPG